MSCQACSAHRKAKMKKRPQKFTLNEIPDHIVVKILYKMPAVAYTRMRRTCRYLNQTVEDNEEAFSKRVYSGGIFLTIDTKIQDGNIVLIYYCDGRGTKPEFFTPGVPFENRFSGVAIRHIEVWSNGNATDNRGLIADFFRRLKPTCNELTFFCHCTLAYQVRMADLVECRTTNFAIVYHRIDIDPVTTLLTGNRKSTYLFAIDSPAMILQRLEDFIHFKEVVCYDLFTNEQIHTLITSISCLTEFGTLKEIAVRFPQEDCFKDPKFNFPMTKLLWDMDDIPPQFERNWKPMYIRKLELFGNKCAIIIRCKNDDKTPIRIVKDDPEVILQILLDSLLIEDCDFEYPNQKEEFMEASEDQLIPMLRDFYVKNVAVRCTRRRNCCW